MYKIKCTSYDFYFSLGHSISYILIYWIEHVKDFVLNILRTVILYSAIN